MITLKNKILMGSDSSVYLAWQDMVLRTLKDQIYQFNTNQNY